MGQAVARAVIADDAAELVALVARPGSALVGTDVTALLGADGPHLSISESLVLDDVDVVVDFTLPESTLHTAKLCAAAGIPVVIGTTGFSGEELSSLESSLSSLAFCRAANFSTGVNLAYRLLTIAAEVMGGDADIEIHEAHHKHKIDAPWGRRSLMPWEHRLMRWRAMIDRLNARRVSQVPLVFLLRGLETLSVSTP
jgi:4-hydroxy-tetrahydrodipicolinate reductase